MVKIEEEVKALSMYRLIIKPKAQKQIEKLGRRDQQRAGFALDRLVHEPFAGKKLRGNHEGYWSMRAWPYRIIYKIEQDIVTVTVIAIGQRKDVYRRL